MTTLEVQVLPINELNKIVETHGLYEGFVRQNPHFSLNDFFRDAA